MTTRADLIARLALNANDIPAWLALAALDARMGRRYCKREAASMGLDATRRTKPERMGQWMRSLIDSCVVVVHAHSHPTMMTAHHPDILEWCSVWLYPERT